MSTACGLLKRVEEVNLMLLVDESFSLQDRDREGDYEVQNPRLQVELEEKRLIAEGDIEKI